jgi:integrase
MTVQNPSYLLKSRHGIWYFQVQIPKRFSQTQKRQLFKKSLKTTNRLLALKQARIWWLKMEENDFQWEEEAETLNEQYHQGKLIYQRLNKLDSNDPVEIAEFLESLTLGEETALRVYNDSLARQTQPTSSQSTSDVFSLSLSELTEKFIAEKRINWGEKQRDSTEHKDYRPKISLFIELVGNKKGSQLTKRDVIKYKESLFKIPANRSKVKQYRNKSIIELLSSDIPESELLSNTTIQNHFVKIGTFLDWMAQNGYCDSSLKTPLHGVIKKTKIVSQHRDVFTEGDLKLLFNNDYYFRNKHRKASQYWIPLLGLFTGARINELCQLYVSDIKEVDGVWVIDINGEDSKKLKSLNAQRQVPIHSILINQLRFLEHVKKLRGKETRLFPELEESRDGYSQAFSKWFNRTYKKNVNVGQLETEQKNFHSFRHTLSNYYKQLGGIDEYRVAEIIGHKSETTSITYDRYGKSSAITQKKELIEQLKLDFIKFDKFRIWES